jgi:hypothetical protein
LSDDAGCAKASLLANPFRLAAIPGIGSGLWGCTPKPSKIPSNWISDFHSLVQPSFADIGSIFTATIPFVAEEFRSISMPSWQTWRWKKAKKNSVKLWPDGIFGGLGLQPCISFPPQCG